MTSSCAEEDRNFARDEAGSCRGRLIANRDAFMGTGRAVAFMWLGSWTIQRQRALPIPADEHTILTRGDGIRVMGGLYEDPAQAHLPAEVFAASVLSFDASTSIGRLRIVVVEGPDQNCTKP